MPPIRLLCLAGDGIGPEIMAATIAVLKAVRPALDRPIETQSLQIGLKALEATGTTLPTAVIEAAQDAHGVLLGPVSHNDYPPSAEGGVNPSGILRKKLDLFANIRPAKSWPGARRRSR